MATTVVSLLRGVNIVGRHKIKMDVLRGLFESLGFVNPRTFIQSGNVVFRTRARDLAKLAGRIEKAIEDSHGFRPAVVLRTCQELREVVARSPFAGRSGIQPSKLAVVFLARDPGDAARRAIREIRTNPEELHILGRELYIYFPEGMGQTKLSVAKLERTLDTLGTARNWNTVNKLLAMAEELEADA